MASTECDFIFVNHVEYMNDFWGVTRNTLQSYVGRLFITVINWKLIFKDGYFISIFKLYFYRKSLFTKFTLKIFPEKRRYYFSLALNLFIFEPLFQAF